MWKLVLLSLAASMIVAGTCMPQREWCDWVCWWMLLLGIQHKMQAWETLLTELQVALPWNVALDKIVWSKGWRKHVLTCSSPKCSQSAWVRVTHGAIPLSHATRKLWLTWDSAYILEEGFFPETFRDKTHWVPQTSIPFHPSASPSPASRFQHLSCHWLTLLTIIYINTSSLFPWNGMTIQPVSFSSVMFSSAEIAWMLTISCSLGSAVHTEWERAWTQLTAYKVKYWI